jgi:phosphoglycolate phosphatase-like HAD superfamily hydrolase
MKKKLLIYDLDGTLINSKKDILQGFNYSFKKWKVKRISISFFYKNASLGSLYLIKKNLKKEQYKKINFIKKDFDNYYNKNLLNNTKLKVGVNFFLKWSSKYFINVISTNKKTNVAKKIIKKLKIQKFIDNVYGADYFQYKKPDTRHLHSILNKHKMKKKDVIYFGDSDVDSKMCSKLSVFFILLDHGYTSLNINRISKNFLIKNFYDAKKIILKMI